MPVSEHVATEHVNLQSARLAQSAQRAFWLRFLYHATHVTNAVDIVQAGSLSCREGGHKFHDVANQGALAAYEGSHQFARLYFRPKNNYHIRTEGIKVLCDPYRQPQHASIPVMFLFDAVKVLSRPGTLFTAGNIQRVRNSEMSSDDEFQALDFSAIYHDDAVTPDNRDHIQDRRMAEVMVPQNLPLAESLEWIVFRTSSDMRTFDHLLKQVGGKCPYPKGTEKVPQSIFMHWGLYISELSFVEDKLIMNFHLPTRTRPPGNAYKFSIRQNCVDGQQRNYNNTFALDRPALTITGFVPDANSVWSIELEDVLAFNGTLPHAQSTVFG